MADRRKRSYFPSIDSRFTGALEPSPNTGSYYNPARYANQGFSRPELSRIQSNLSNVYNQDLEYNRVANPRYQTEQDTGYGSTDQFGSGRASAATTQNYARQFGTPTGNGLSTFQTPSGGSITYKPSGRTLPGGAQPAASPFADVLGPSNQSAAYQQGFGAPPAAVQPSVSGPVLSQGGVSNPIENTPGQPSFLQSFFPGVSQLQGFAKAAQSVYNRLNPAQPNQGNSALSVVQGMQQGQTAGQALQAYAAPPQSGPRRYFDPSYNYNF